MIPNNFSDYYKTISNTELLEILDHQQNYQPLAIEAAKKELENRKLSDQEIMSARRPLLLQELQKEEQRAKIKAISNKVKNAGNTLVDTINPVQAQTPNTEKLIRLISIGLFLLFLFKIIDDFKMFSGMIKDISRFDSSSFFCFLPFVILPIASITFWMKKTFGWMLSAFFIIYTAVEAIWILVDSFNWQSTETSLDKLFPRPSPITYIIQLIFLLGTLYVISKADIRSVFKINKPRLLATIIMSLLITTFLMLEF